MAGSRCADGAIDERLGECTQRTRANPIMGLAGEITDELDRCVAPQLTSVMIGAILEERDADRRARRQNPANSSPTVPVPYPARAAAMSRIRSRRAAGERQTPPRRTGRATCTTSPRGHCFPPYPRQSTISGNPNPNAISGSAAGCPNESGQYNTGRGCRAEPIEDRAPDEKIPNQRLAAWNQLVRKHVPWAGLNTAIPQQSRPARSLLIGTNLEVVVEHNRLPIEQKAFILAWRIIDQFVDDVGKTLTKDLDRLIPLAVPMGVCDDVDLERQGGGDRWPKVVQHEAVAAKRIAATAQ